MHETTASLMAQYRDNSGRSTSSSAARLRFVPVEIAQRNTAFAEVVNGVSEECLVILHPSDRVSDGIRVTAVSTGG